MDNDQLEGGASTKPSLSPREAAVKELCTFIQDKIREGHSIMIDGDGNETSQESVTGKGVRKYSMEWLFQQTGLEDVCMH